MQNEGFGEFSLHESSDETLSIVQYIQGAGSALVIAARLKLKGMNTAVHTEMACVSGHQSYRKDQGLHSDVHAAFG